MDWSMLGPYLLVALVALVGVLLIVSLIALRAAGGRARRQPEFVLSYDSYWEKRIARRVRKFLERRFGNGSVYSLAFDTEKPAPLETNIANLIGQAPSFVALACQHFVESASAREQLETRRNLKAPVTVLVIQKSAHEELQQPNVAAHFREAIEAKRYATLYDDSSPTGGFKTGEALRQELERLFPSRPAGEEAATEARYEYFISYNHATGAAQDSLARASSEVAEELYAHLQKFVDEEKIFLDEKKLKLGQDLGTLPALAAQARNFIPLVSHLYFSRNTVAEITAFLKAKKKDASRSLIPFFLEPEDTVLDQADEQVHKEVRENGLSDELRRVYSFRVYCGAGGELLRGDQLRARIAEEFARGRALSDLLKPEFDHHVPETANFMGREKEIGRIAERLQLGPPDASHRGLAPMLPSQSPQLRVLIQAGPGFGKTTLAASFARRMRGRLCVWWLRSENRATLLAEVQRIAGTEGESGTKVSERDAIALMHRRFREQRLPYLLVFDNVQRATEQLVLDLCNAVSQNVRILITERSILDTLVKADDVISLNELELDDATELLVKLATNPASASRRDPKKARELARKLGCLPLALTNAGPVCRVRSFGYVLDSWDERSKMLRSKDPVYITLSECLDAAEQKVAGSIGRQKHVRDVTGLLSYCAAERVPESLLDACFPNDTLDTTEVLEALFELGLIKAGNFERADEKWYSLHRLNQRFIRDDVEEEGRGGEIIARLMPSLCRMLMIEDVETDRLDIEDGEKRLAFNKYFPHFLAALRHLDAPEFRGAEAGAPLDEVAKLVMLKLKEDAAGGLNLAEDDESWNMLPSLLGCFYEVDPFEHVLDHLIEVLSKNTASWRKFLEGCLAQNNYVLRFALADALARAIEGRLLSIDEVTRLFDEGRSLNELELGGYAFKALASRNLALAQEHREFLKTLAEHNCYPGRSILGDLMLNLVYRGQTPSQLLPLQDGAAFWSPVWEFVSYDVYAVRAAEFARGLKQPDMSKGARARFLAESAYLERYRRWQQQAIVAVRSYPKLSEIVENVEAIGKETDAIADAKDEFRTLADKNAHEPVLRLLFGHPLWSVAERMASVIAELHAEDKTRRAFYRDIILSMFKEEDWRVRYGAIEAAFQIRQTESNATFFEAVKYFYGDDNSKIRGLCAENLFSIFLNQSDASREELERLFDAEIASWMADDDCWVLEHVYRYFRALHERAKKDDSAKRSLHRAASAKSLLLKGLGDWWKQEREIFLRHIEHAKRGPVELPVAKDQSA